MALVQKRKKLNDFVWSRKFTHNKPTMEFAWTCGGLGVYFTNHRDEDHVYLYHTEKVRPKFKRVVEYYKTGARKGQVKKSEMVQVREGGWATRIFKIPKAMVKNVRQHTRHCDVVLK